MLFEVIELRRNGLRLRASELAAPVLGSLATVWMSPSNFGRPLRCAELTTLVGANAQKRQMLHTLLDVQLEAIVDGALSLSGVQLVRSEDGRITEYRQVWRCTPVAPHFGGVAPVAGQPHTDSGPAQ